MKLNGVYEIFLKAIC